jgi:tRNA threonylcarbamoyladenosine biosynthesis protein TsaE
MSIMIPHNSDSGQMLVVCGQSMYNSGAKVAKAMPILDEHTLDFISHSSAQTHRLGIRLGQCLQAGDLVCLEGDLGSGKTCLAQGIGQGMGINDPITSPTFVLIAEYQSPRPAPPLYHIDLYRLGDAVDEALALGLEDYIHGDGVCLIEWAERARPALPEERLWITLRHVDMSKRGIVMQAAGARYDGILGEFRKTTFGS